MNIDDNAKFSGWLNYTKKLGIGENLYVNIYVAGKPTAKDKFQHFPSNKEKKKILGSIVGKNAYSVWKISEKFENRRHLHVSKFLMQLTYNLKVA